MIISRVLQEQCGFLPLAERVALLADSIWAFGPLGASFNLSG